MALPSVCKRSAMHLKSCTYYDQHQLHVRSNSPDKTRVENEKQRKSDNFSAANATSIHWATEGSVVKF